MTNWLQSLNAGDKVIIEHGQRVAEIRNVSKVTATQIVVDTLRFKRDSGREVGATRWAKWIKECTEAREPALREAMARRKAMDALATIFTFAERRESLTTDQLTRMAAIAAEQQPERDKTP